MLEVLQSIAALLVTLAILVTIHEFGHYAVARLCGVHVLRFSIGFGKSLYTRRGRVPAPVPVPAGQDIQTRANEPLQGTEFSIAALPLGGYVKMLDEREGFVPDDQLHLAFNRKPVLQRIAIVAAGPIANFLLAIVAYWMLFAVGVNGVVPLLDTPAAETAAAKAGLRENLEIVAIDSVPTNTWSEVNLRLFSRIGDTGTITITAVEFQSADDALLKEPLNAGQTGPTQDYVIDVTRWLSDVEEPHPTQALGLTLRFPEIPAIIGQVMDGEPAMQAGLQAGDKVTQANGQVVKDWQQWVMLIQQNPSKEVSLVVERAADTLYMTVVPRLMERENQSVGYIGASRQSIELPPEMQRVISYPVYSAWLPAVEKTWTVTLFTLDSIKKMIMGAISHKNLSGPITIAQVASATAQSGIESFVGFIALLSISLGVLNLLPIPVLDGGHLLYYFIELVTRRPVPERIQLWGLQFGMFVIVSVMLLAFYNDLTRL
jgi:regulator of sigma E protease